MKYLINQGADIGGGDGVNNLSALYYAANLGHLDIVKHLVSQGADINDQVPFPYKMKEGKKLFMYNASPLFAAVTMDHYPIKPTSFSSAGRVLEKAKVIRFLVDSGADMGTLIELSSDKNLPDPTAFVHHYTLLHWIVRNDYDIEIAKALVGSGFDVDSRNNKNNTPLHFAVQFAGKYKHLNMVKYLVGQGADVEATSHPSLNVLYWSTVSKYLPVVQYLVEDQGVGVKALVDSMGNSEALWGAARVGHVDIFKYLVNKGALTTDTTKTNASYNIFLYHTCKFGNHLEMVEHLVGLGASVDYSISKTTVLHLASKGGFLEVVKYLVGNNAKINPKNSDGKTPLDLADDEGHTDVVSYLESQGGKRGTEIQSLTQSSQSSKTMEGVEPEAEAEVFSE